MVYHGSDSGQLKRRLYWRWNHSTRRERLTLGATLKAQKAQSLKYATNGFKKIFINFTGLKNQKRTLGFEKCFPLTEIIQKYQFHGKNFEFFVLKEVAHCRITQKRGGTFQAH